MTTCEFHPEAEEEFVAAADHYESCEPGLGIDFADEILATIDNILAFPTAWPVLDGDIRRCQTRRFPYGVVHSVEPKSVFILAVMHLHRDPDYWKDRLD